MCKKDYSLLRLFDIEAAKRGEAICFRSDGSKRIYMAGPDKTNLLCVEDPVDGRLVLAHVDKYRMAPLCWVKGKPVYKGDVLYYNGVGRGVIAGMETDGLEVLILYDNKPEWGPTGAFPENLTWTPPKVKREAWVNVYKDSRASFRHDTREKADKAARTVNGIIDPNRVACIHIEWDE